jgi:hypothetical protein
MVGAGVEFERLIQFQTYARAMVTRADGHGIGDMHGRTRMRQEFPFLFTHISAARKDEKLKSRVWLTIGMERKMTACASSSLRCR